MRCAAWREPLKEGDGYRRVTYAGVNWAVVHALWFYQGSAAQADDITLLVVHHTAAPISIAER